MRQAILDSNNNVLYPFSMAIAWQDCLGEKIYLAQIDDDGKWSKRKIYITPDYNIMFMNEWDTLNNPTEKQDEQR